MTENQKTVSTGENNQNKPKKKNNNYYRKNKNRPYSKPYNNLQSEQSQAAVCPEPKAEAGNDLANENKTGFIKSNYGGYKRYNKDRKNGRDAVETVDDVKKDILRIEKEIRLEIEEIKMIRL